MSLFDGKRTPTETRVMKKTTDFYNLIQGVSEELHGKAKQQKRDKFNTVKGCKHCDNRNERKAVLGRGNKKAHIMIIDESPDFAGVSTGQLFYGNNGKILGKLLEGAGLTFEDVYCTTLVKCRTNKGGAPTQEVIHACSKYLDNEIQKIQPKLIVALGTTVKDFFGERKSLAKIRGQVINVDGYPPILVTHRPAYLRKNRSAFNAVQGDFQILASKEWDFDPLTHRGYTLLSTIDAVKDVARKLIHADKWSFDIEATGLRFASLKYDAETMSDKKLMLLSVSFSLKERESVCIPLDHPESTWTVKERGYIQKILQKVFASKALKIGHNVSFDISALTVNGIPVVRPFWDTMIGAYLLQENGALSLEAVINRNTSMPPYKSMVNVKNLYNEPLGRVAAYNNSDTDGTLRCYNSLSAKMQENHHYVMDKIVMPGMEALAFMERTGILLDENRLVELDAFYGAEEQKLKEVFFTKHKRVLSKASGGGEFNINSSQQLVKLLFGVMKFPVDYYTKKKQPSTQAKHLKLLKKRDRTGIISDLLAYRKVSKLRTTYIDGSKERVCTDGRLHTHYNYGRTVTGRLSSSDPNLQNIPKKGRVKQLFIPGDDRVFIQLDYSQIEYRLLAEYSKDPNLIKAFNSGVDFHSATAANFLDIPLESVTSDDRSAGKTFNFGVVYGVSIQALYELLKGMQASKPKAEQKKVTLADVKRKHAKYLSTIKVAKKWMEKVERQAVEAGYVTSMFGRERHLPYAQLRGVNKWEKTEKARALRQAVNAVIQSAASDITLMALYELYEALMVKGLDAHLVFTVHDSIGLSVHKSQAKKVAYLAKLIMERVPARYVHSVPIKVDVEMGKNWFDLKELRMGN